MKHPLTDEMIIELIGDRNLFHCLTEDDMRVAYDKGADWQLEQVIEWIAKNVDGSYLRDTGDFWQKIEVEDILSDLKDAMRPQEDN